MRHIKTIVAGLCHFAFHLQNAKRRQCKGAIFKHEKAPIEREKVALKENFDSFSMRIYAH